MVAFPYIAIHARPYMIRISNLGPDMAIDFILHVKDVLHNRQNTKITRYIEEKQLNGTVCTYTASILQCIHLSIYLPTDLPIVTFHLCSDCDGLCSKLVLSIVLCLARSALFCFHQLSAGSRP